MTVSIIIAVKACCENLGECVSRCLELKFGDFEIIILPDSSFPAEGVFSSPKIRIIPTGDVTPPFKRDIGARQAKAEIIAFLDDDAYPDKEWLSQAIKIFNEDKDIGCVCGPAVTPLSDSLMQKASGLVYSSIFISGNHIFRYIPQKRKQVFDFPSCNFLIKKELFEKVGGFDKPFWPGEDTFLCLKVLNSGKKMIYDPKVLVFHHRRTLFGAHLKQIKNYALHRGYFAKKYPKTSLQIEYFIPSIFVLGLLFGGVGAVFSSIVAVIYRFLVFLYLVIASSSGFFLGFKTDETLVNRIKLSVFTSLGIILTHLSYGVYLVKGLFAQKMPEE